MSSAGLQSVTDLVSLIDTNWVSANTDNVKPNITDSLTTPWQDIDFGPKGTIYIKYEAAPVITTLHAAEFFHDVAVTIEVMCTTEGTLQGGRAHFKKLMDEVMRIIKANARQSGYARTIIRDERSRFNKDRRIFDGQIDVEMLKIKTS